MIIFKNPDGFGCIKRLNGNRYRPYMFCISLNGKQTPVAYFCNYLDAVKYRNDYVQQNKALAPIKEVFNWREQKYVEPIKMQFKQDEYKKHLENKSPTFAEIYNLWLPAHQARYDVSKSTLGSYANAFKHCKILHDKSIAEIKYNDLQSIIDGIGEKNLSYSTKKKVRNLLSLIFQHAMAMDYIQKNYVELIDIGKNKPIRPHKPFSIDEIKLIWKEQNRKGIDTILILLYTGMRVGELLELEKENVNLEEKYFYIKKSKTAAGIRFIPVHSRVFNFVQKRMNGTGKYFLMNGDNKYSYSSFCSLWEKIMLSLKLKHSTHDCRHTVASRLDACGANEIAKRRILGHAVQNVTEGYTHKSIKELRDTIELLT